MDVRNKMIEIIRDIGTLVCSDDELIKSHDLINLGLSSIELMQIIVRCEDTFDVVFDDDILQLEIINDFEKMEEIIKGLIT